MKVICLKYQQRFVVRMNCREIYTADFETTVDENDCRVWAVGVYNIYKDSFFYYNNITDFMQYCMNIYSNDIFFFHNLKFDGDFIMNHLFEKGYEWVDDSKKLETKTFTTTISDKGQFYSIEVCFYNDNGYKNACIFYDSLKLLPMSVSKIARAFGLEEKKLNIDYKECREIGHKLTKNEVEYLKNDVVIVGKALVMMYEQNLKGLTIGSNALRVYKKILTTKKFNQIFPIVDEECDDFIRKSYRGGFVWCNPRYKGKEVGCGNVYDVNSLYPSRMHSTSGCVFPYGVPQYYKGKYKKNKTYPLYVCRVILNFEIKEGKIPCIQIKRNYFFSDTEYVRTSKGRDVELYLTNIDLELIFEQYHIYNIEYLDGYMFRGSSGFFDEYIDTWTLIKEKATIEKNEGLRTIAKLLLNNLYGKFGTNPRMQSKIPNYIDKKVGFSLSSISKKPPVYTPIATFVTAYARMYTIQSAQKVGLKNLLYCDTDSIHCLEESDVSCLEIHETKLGAWKHETHFDRAKFLRSKCYIEESGGKLKVTVAGLPEQCHKQVTFENFKIGAIYKGKMRMKRVHGGIVLVDTDFTIKL